MIVNRGDGRRPRPQLLDKGQLPNANSPSSRTLPPLPSGPVGPSAWNLLHYAYSPLPFLEGCAARYGEAFTVRFATHGPFVMLADPAAVRDVFRADPHVLHSGEGNEFLIPAVGKN